MAADEKWYFTKDQLQNTPSRKCGFDADKELSYRQQAANFIQDMGQKLQVSQLCINTAIVYMHRFYMFHSFTHFPWNTIAAASFFLAAKVEEQPRKLEHVIRVANICLHREQPTVFDAKSEQYAAQSQDLVFNENVLLQTLGFDVAIDHPHTHVVRCCHLVRASKDLAQTSYFMASNSLHLTTMCLQYKPTVVACFCIHLACKWSNWQIPKSNENKDWFYYVDKTVTSELLEQLTTEFLLIFDKCPSRLKKKILSISNSSHSMDQTQVPTTNSPFDTECRKIQGDNKEMASHMRSHHEIKQALLATPEDPYKKPQRSHEASTSQQRLEHREYKEKKERERLEREKAAQQHGKVPLVPGKHPAGAGAAPSGKPPHSHHRPPVTVDPKLMKHHRPSGSREVADGVREPAPQHHRGDLQKREYPQRPDASEPSVKVESVGSVEKPRYESNRAKVPPDSKVQVKHEINRHRRSEVDPKSSSYQKRGEGQPAAPAPANDVIKKVTAPAAGNPQEKPNSFVKQSNSTSQRHKSPFSDVPKSVPVSASAKQDSRNGNHLISSSEEARKPWPEPQPLLADPGLLTPPAQPPKRMPSLFSPEKTSPQKKSWNPSKTQAPKKPTAEMPVTQNSIPAPVSPFGSPPARPSSAAVKRSRTSSSGSEPELRPVVKKLDQMYGFENIMRDSKMGIKLPKVPDIIQPIHDRQEATSSALEPSAITKELKPPEIIRPFNTSLTEQGTAASGAASQPLVNGIETDPAIISNLLKEVAPLNNAVEPVKPAEAVVVAAVTEEPVVKQKSEHHHKSEKKKKKEKHKHKDRDKGKEEKKKKHKDKDKERHKIKDKVADVDVSAPLKFTITTGPGGGAVATPSAPEPAGLKVKISKDRIKSENISEPTTNGTTITGGGASSGSLKIKIPKDAIQQYNSATESTRKRDREPSGIAAPPAKVMKTGYGGRGAPERQNGRNSYTKVAQLGDGEPSQLRLAESKYHIKGTSKTS